MLPDWNRRYPNCEPIGHRLREEFADRWVRFHGLPDSKRYPEDEAEYAEILARHNRILGELTAPGGRVVLLTTGYAESSEPIRTCPALAGLDPGAMPWRTIPLHDANDASFHPHYWHLFASQRVWVPGAFDPLIRLVADDVVANVLVAAADCRWVLHPYDGGMDVIAESGATRNRLSSRYAGWLSARPDGL